MPKLLIAALAALLLPAATSADERNFVLQNATGRTISELYISPTNVNEWEEDVLGVDQLADEGEVKINFSDDLDECVYDLKIVHDDGDSAIWTGINLCEAYRVIPAYEDDGTPVAQVSTEEE